MVERWPGYFRGHSDQRGGEASTVVGLRAQPSGRGLDSPAGGCENRILTCAAPSRETDSPPATADRTGRPVDGSKGPLRVEGSTEALPKAILVGGRAPRMVATEDGPDDLHPPKRCDDVGLRRRPVPRRPPQPARRDAEEHRRRDGDSVGRVSPGEVRMGEISRQRMALSSRALRGARARRVLEGPPEAARHGDVQGSDDTGRGEERRGGRFVCCKRTAGCSLRGQGARTALGRAYDRGLGQGATATSISARHTRLHAQADGPRGARGQGRSQHLRRCELACWSIATLDKRQCALLHGRAHYDVETQPTVTLSTAESELMAMEIAVQKSQFAEHMLEHLGEKTKIVLHSDVSAARAIVARCGAGRLKHLAVREVWLQDQLREGKLSLVKVASENNVANMKTKVFAMARHHWLRNAIGVICDEGDKDAERV
eukprot:7756208-Heterocapsa_arctica.AAC.1